MWPLPFNLKTLALVALGVALAGSLYQLRGAKLELADYKLSVSQAETQAQAERNADIMVRMRNNERIQDEDNKRELALAAERAAVAVTVRSLRGEVTRLNNRPVPTDPSAAAYAGEARAARSALEQCTERYSWMDGAAKSLGSQVMGLQAFATDVCKASQVPDLVQQDPALAPQ